VKQQSFEVRFQNPLAKSMWEPPVASQTIISGNFLTPCLALPSQVGHLASISFAQFTVAYTRGWEADSPNSWCD
jgi:hypothetical protein